MASPAKTDIAVTSVETAEIIPIEAGDRLLPASSDEAESPYFPSRIEEYGEWAGHMLGDASYFFGRIYGEIQSRVTDVYDEIASRSRRLAKDTRQGAQSIKEERPFEMLAVIAGVAFAAGAVVRIWRSRRES